METDQILKEIKATEEEIAKQQCKLARLNAQLAEQNMRRVKSESESESKPAVAGDGDHCAIPLKRSASGEEEDEVVEPTGQVKRIKSSISKAEDIQIFVRTLHGKTTALKLNPHDLVEDIKAAVAETGVPVNMQRLIYCGKQLENGRTLEESQIVKDSTIHLVTRLLSCKQCPSRH